MFLPKYQKGRSEDDIESRGIQKNDRLGNAGRIDRGLSRFKQQVFIYSSISLKLRRDIMTKAELVAEIAKKSGLAKADAERALNSFVEVAKKTLKKEGRLALAGFGSFTVNKRKARTGRNPRTGETIKIKAKKVVKFKAGKALGDSI
jgi:DNA-binding protein HU-beta